MTLSELRSLVRDRTRGTVSPYLMSDAEIDANLNEAQREACVRALLLEDDVSITIDLNTTDKRYALDPRVIDVIDIAIGVDKLRAFTDGWTLTDGYLELERVPHAEDTLTLHCYLLPAQSMTDDDDAPEIRPIHHEALADWAIHLYYLIPDADMFDGKAADRYLSRFVQAFGERPSALTLRNRRSKTMRCVQNNGYI